MENRNSVYIEAYARKILGLTIGDINNLKRSKKSKYSIKPINKHGNYDGTDIGFTSNSVETSNNQKNTSNKQTK